MNISFPHEVIGLKPHKVMEGITLSSSDGTKTTGNLLLICNTRDDSLTERPLLNRRLRVHVRNQEPRHQVPVVQNVDSPINLINHYIQRISIRETNSAVQWIEIYSVGRAVQLLDNWGQMFKLLFLKFRRGRGFFL